jgi:hypothetical protein
MGMAVSKLDGRMSITLGLREYGWSCSWRYKMNKSTGRTTISTGRVSARIYLDDLFFFIAPIQG